MVTSFIADLKTALLDIVLPPHCILCGGLVEEGEVPSLCDGCILRRPPPPGSRCRVCAAALPGIAVTTGRCLNCRRRRPPWESLTVVGEHDGLLRELIHRLKFGRCPAAAAPLGRFLADAVLADPAWAFDLIVPVPLDPRRLRTRGFNQSELLVRELSVRSGVPVDCRCLRRRAGRAPQVGRSRAARQALGASRFRVDRPIFGRRILLVDDVLTTGATIRAASQTLLGEHALGVHAAAISRTVRG